MLHEAIFLATCNATMMTEKTLQVAEGMSHVRNVFAQLATCATRSLEIVYNYISPGRQLKMSREQKTRTYLLIFTKLHCTCDGYVTRSNLSRNVAKS